MKYFTLFSFFLAALFLMTACNKFKGTDTGKTATEISFKIKAGELLGGLKSTEALPCFEVKADFVQVQIDDSVYKIDVFYVNDIPYTNTIKLSTGTHTLKEFTLWSDNNTPANLTDDVLLAATPHTGSTYAGFVITPVNIPFSINEFTKIEFPIEVVCYEADHYDDFGFTYFQLNEIVVREETFFGDICIRNINDYTGSLYAQQSQGLQPDMPAIFKIEVYCNGILTATFNNEAWKGEGQPLKATYGDNLHQADHFEFKLYVLVKKDAGFSYMYYHTWTFDDAQIIPQGSDGVVDFVLGSCNPSADVVIPFSGTYFTCGDVFTDSRDGKIYHTVLVGTQCWMKENLNVGQRIDGSQSQAGNGIIEKYCYNDLESNCDIYGGLYQWDEVMQGSTTAGDQGICPSDWHVPADAEWTALTDNLGGEAVSGGKLKEEGVSHWSPPNTGGNNSSGFTALPAGVRDLNGNFFNLGTYAYFWSSSTGNNSGAWDRDLNFDYESVNKYSYEKIYGWSTRCIKN